ncbi:MAG: thiamine-phosphate kinase [Porticoccaceae bacterium]|nr:thiamine-phosphate kinase [Porticoccaceae bacterium]MDG1308123.1 thiamine-phosphate kinase [Porticoccaceae bacterium]
MEFTSTQPREFELIATYFKDLTDRQGVALGIGDDGALVNPSTNTQLVVATDTLVESVHFPAHASAEQIATRALCVNLSDMAAMGATPRWFTLALTIEKADPSWLAGFSRGLAEIAKEFGVALIGGDTTSGPLTISLTLLGEVSVGGALQRDGAKAGDSIYVTGNLGDGAASLHALQYPDAEHEIQRLRARFYRPQPQVQVGQKLQGMASACIDISDGLIADLGHICQASGVSANLDSKLLPIHPDVTRQFPQQALDWALSGGDDYQLCFTVAESSRDRIERLILSGELDATMIGEILPSAETGSLVMVDKIGAQLNKGFDHFGH